jgi:hypothetical protein
MMLATAAPMRFLFAVREDAQSMHEAAGYISAFI